MIKHLISFALATVLVSGCSLYKMEIQQGNNISAEELAMVRPGMSAAQVQSILGSPLLVDDFHKNRWDYVFYLKQPNGTVERRGVTVFFQNNIVREIRQDTPAESVASK